MTEIIKEGDNLPDMAIKAIVKDEIKDTKLSTLFADHSLMHPKDKKIVLFSVPGAFTPTCSAKHLPGFLTYASAFKEKKVDAIVCLSVNDPFVMAAWGNDKGTGDKMLMVGDGNGELTEALGLSMDGSGFGLGKRSLRYSMIIDDNSLTKLNVEENPGEVATSSAETILSQL